MPIILLLIRFKRTCRKQAHISSLLEILFHARSSNINEMVLLYPIENYRLSARLRAKPICLGGKITLLAAWRRLPDITWSFAWIAALIEQADMKKY
jgi:hypothetical protein